MKKLQYTLIELLAAMSIFILMMGLLFNVFVNAATLVGSQTAKVTILSDASVFFTYISNDLANIQLATIPRFEDKDYDPDGGGNPIDSENGNPSLEAAPDPMTITSTKIAFRSSVDSYDGTANPYVGYEYDAAKGEVYRSMNADEASYSKNAEAIILDGVVDFEIKVWDDFAGGVELNESTYEIKPACVTISITLTTPNPDASTETKTQNKRTVTKTIYLDR